METTENNVTINLYDLYQYEFYVSATENFSDKDHPGGFCTSGERRYV
jgi:hypothetical protein